MNLLRCVFDFMFTDQKGKKLVCTCRKVRGPGSVYGGKLPKQNSTDLVKDTHSLSGVWTPPVHQRSVPQRSGAPRGLQYPNIFIITLRLFLSFSQEGTSPVFQITWEVILQRLNTRSVWGLTSSMVTIKIQATWTKALWTPQ